MASKSTQKALRNLTIAAILLVMATIIGLAFKFLIYPKQQDELVRETGSTSRYAHTIRIAADAFAGYAVLRSPFFQDAMAAQGIKIEVLDDGADFSKRARALAAGDVELAAFTVDSLLATAGSDGQLPGTMVLVLDETKGADGMVAYKTAVPDIDALNHPDARIVATPNSPSETLARATITDFDLEKMSRGWLVKADGARDVYKRLRTADASARYAYVLWEPMLSKALALPGVHVLIDSSHMQGVILDVLVARRQFLSEKREQVDAVVEAYLRALYQYEHQSEGMPQLVQEDGRQLGDPLSMAQSQRIAGGIQWKNTLENYAYFNVLDEPIPGAMGLEDVIDNIARILTTTGAMDKNPFEGRGHELFYGGSLRTLYQADFHPGRPAGSGGGGSLRDEELRQVDALEPLSAVEWAQLTTIGNMRIPSIGFRRAGSKLTIQGERDVKKLIRHLRAWPTYYIKVVGHARAEGDPAANRALALQRAQVVADRIVRGGISENRVRANGAAPKGTGGGMQSVSFVLGMRPY